MQKKHLMVKLVSPERVVYSNFVEMVVVPGKMGDLGVLPKHEALVSILRPGFIEIFEEKETSKHIYVKAGFVEVADDVCSILADELLPIEEIDMENLQTFIQNTRENLEMAQTKKEKTLLKEELHGAELKFELMTSLLAQSSPSKNRAEKS